MLGDMLEHKLSLLTCKDCKLKNSMKAQWEFRTRKPCSAFEVLSQSHWLNALHGE